VVTELRSKYLILMTGIILLFGITADPFELYSQSDSGLAFAMDGDDDDDDRGCPDDDDDGSSIDDDNDGDSSDEDDNGTDTTVGATTGGMDHDDDDDGADDDDDCVGGSGMSINKSALLVSGFQTHGSWMIPVLLAALGIGIVVARKL